MAADQESTEVEESLAGVAGGMSSQDQQAVVGGVGGLGALSLGTLGANSQLERNKRYYENIMPAQDGTRIEFPPREPPWVAEARPLAETHGVFEKYRTGKAPIASTSTREDQASDSDDPEIVTKTVFRDGGVMQERRSESGRLIERTIKAPDGSSYRETQNLREFTGKDGYTDTITSNGTRVSRSKGRRPLVDEGTQEVLQSNPPQPELSLSTKVGTKVARQEVVGKQGNEQEDISGEL